MLGTKLAYWINAMKKIEMANYVVIWNVLSRTTLTKRCAGEYIILMAYFQGLKTTSR